jgi:hypothetical protein
MIWAGKRVNNLSRSGTGKMHKQISTGKTKVVCRRGYTLFTQYPFSFAQARHSSGGGFA